jgi:hypothetical protein
MDSLILQLALFFSNKKNFGPKMGPIGRGNPSFFLQKEKIDLEKKN